MKTMTPPRATPPDDERAHGPVLVVDDSAAHCLLVLAALSECGYEVRTAAGALEAMVTIEELRPRVLLVGLALPHGDSEALIRRVRSDPALSGVVVLAVGRRGAPGDRETASRLGCDGYLTRPINPRTLCLLLAMYLSPAAG